MAAKTRYTVPHPDGTTSTRTSATRSYAAALVAEPADPATWQAAHERKAQAARDKADKIRAARDSKSAKLRNRGFGSGGYNSHEAYYTDAPEVSVYASAKGMSIPAPNEDGSGDRTPVPCAKALRERADDTIEMYENQARDMDRIAQAGPAPKDRTYEVVRWSSRHDLAEKARNDFGYLAEVGHRLTVVDVQKQ